MDSLRQAHQSFVDNLKKEGRANATILAYGKDIDQLVGFLEGIGKSDPKAVETRDLAEFMAGLAKEGYTPKSVSRKTNSTKTFFRFLKKQNLLETDPATSLAHPRFETKPPRILSKMEYRALRDACRHDVRTSAIVELLLQTGVRIAELANIRKEDIEFGGGDKPGILHVRSLSTLKGRDVPLNKAAQKAIQAYLEERPESRFSHLFVTKTGRPLLVRNIRSVIDRYFKIAGIPDAKVNDLRHTFVAYHLKQGISLVNLSQISGHKRLSTTEKYLQYVERPKEESQELSEL